MAVYFVTGKLGSGKSLYAITEIQRYMRAGRRVATNLDIYPEKMLHRNSRQTAIRLPDRPRIADLQALGTGCETYDENQFGLLVLDECSHFLNARTWNDKDRAELIDWFTMARKLHWDIIFLVQDISMMDKQVRDALCEHLVICRRLDRVKVPILPGLRLPLPQAHLALVFLGDNPTTGVIVDRKLYRGKHLYEAYDTQQVFRHEYLFRKDGGDPLDFRASYSFLSPWHLAGRYYVPPDYWAIIGDALQPVIKSIALVSIYLTAAITLTRPRTVARNWGLLRPTISGPAAQR